MSLRNFFNHRVRGVRAIELWAGGLTVALALGVYLAKTSAGDEGADIARAQRAISEEQRQIRLLRAEVAYLEQPERLERLSSAYLNLQPMSGAREASLDNLADIANSRGLGVAIKSNVPTLLSATARAAALQAQAEQAAQATQGAQAAPAASDALVPPGTLLAMSAQTVTPR